MFKVRDSILEQLKTVPMEPGVYLMKDAFGKIIYVGKAKRLKNRLSSYFHGVDKHPNKTKALVVNTVEFEYIIVTSEAEALILEANFIKKNQPKFNIALKDDKSYPLVRITKETYPRVQKVRKVEGTDKHYGPFTSDYDVNMVLDALKSLYPIRRCDVPLETIKRPCLYYHMGQCIGPCRKVDLTTEYDALMEKIHEFFKGDRKALVESLTTKRDEASRALDFEQAIIFRDQLECVEHLTHYQKMLDVKLGTRDYIALETKGERVCVTVFERREGKLQERQNFIIENTIEKEKAEMLQEFIVQYYKEANFVPPEIVLEAGEDLEALESYFHTLTGRKITLTVPKLGEKKQTIDLVKRNAEEYLLKFSERIDKKEREKEELQLIFQTLLSIDSIDRIEAYDISNIFGAMSVGSMVVYEGFEKKPSDYRKFRIKHVKGPDDFHSMKEVLTRRLSRIAEEGFGKVPDLLLMDGGKNQVHAALEVLEELKLSIPVIGMVKDDKHRTKALFYEEQEIALEPSSDLYRFIYGVQEEVHRFALSYHQKLRGKSLAQSILDEVPFIGPKRKLALLQHFGSIDAIREATVDDLKAVGGMDSRASQAVFDYFH
ncbi:excinuclease ABC subunit UvrC [Guggenheimella bovis]